MISHWSSPDICLSHHSMSQNENLGMLHWHIFVISQMHQNDIQSRHHPDENIMRQIWDLPSSPKFVSLNSQTHLLCLSFSTSSLWEVCELAVRSLYLSTFTGKYQQHVTITSPFPSHLCEKFVSWLWDPSTSIFLQANIISMSPSPHLFHLIFVRSLWVGCENPLPQHISHLCENAITIDKQIGKTNVVRTEAFIKKSNTFIFCRTKNNRKYHENCFKHTGIITKSLERYWVKAYILIMTIMCRKTD